MNILCQEIKKQINRNVRLYVLLLFILIVGGIVSSYKYNDDRIEKNKSEYLFYLNEIKTLDEEKWDEYFSQEDRKFSLCESNLQTVYQKVSNRQMTEGEAKKQVHKLKETLSFREGFLCVYEQYAIWKSNGKRGDLIYVNGWDHFYSEKFFNILICFITMFLGIDTFCVEEKNDMRTLLITTKRGGRTSVLIKLIFSNGLSFIYLTIGYVIWILCFNIRFGLSNWDAPIQSLPSFSSYQGEMNICEACFYAYAWKLLGCILLGSIASVWSCFIKNEIVAMTSLGAFIIIIFGIFSNGEQYYYYPGLIGAIWSTGFFKGDILEDGLLNESKLVFRQISGIEKKRIILVDILWIMFSIGYLMVHYNSKYKIKRNYKLICRKIRIVLLCFPIVLCFGCKKQNTQQKEYSMNYVNDNCGESDDFIVYRTYESDEISYKVKDKKTGEVCELIHNPYRERTILDEIYVENQYAYYLELLEDNQNMYFSKQYSMINLIRVDLNNMEEKVLYSEDYSEIGLQQSSVFFVRGNNIYYLGDNNDVYRMNILTGKEKVLIHTDGINLSYEDGKLFYKNSVSQLVSFDLVTEDENVYEDIVLDRFIINGDRILYTDKYENNALVRRKLNSEKKEYIADEPTYMDMDGDAVYYEQDGVLWRYDCHSSKKSEYAVECVGNKIYVFDEYSKIILCQYDGEIKEIEK